MRHAWIGWRGPSGGCEMNEGKTADMSWRLVLDGSNSPICICCPYFPQNFQLGWNPPMLCQTGGHAEDGKSAGLMWYSLEQMDAVMEMGKGGKRKWRTLLVMTPSGIGSRYTIIIAGWCLDRGQMPGLCHQSRFNGLWLSRCRQKCWWYVPALALLEKQCGNQLQRLELTEGWWHGFHGRMIG